MTIKCVAPVEKFRDYVFKPGATHGKDRVFRSPGYSVDDSESLALLYERQASARYDRNEYAVGRQDEYGQRITIKVELYGKGEQADKNSYFAAGWMILLGGGLRLATPFAGFTR